MSNGKGSKPRPISIPKLLYGRNWDKIFGNKFYVGKGMSVEEAEGLGNKKKDGK